VEDIRSHAKKLRGKSARRKIFTTVLVLIIIAGISAGGYFGYMNYVYAPDYTVQDETSIEVIIKVKEGDTPADVAESLVQNEVVKSERAFMQAVRARPNTQLQFGSFRLYKHMSATAALNALLNRSNIVKIKFTIPEGYTVYQVLQTISESSEFTVDDLNDALNTLGDNLPDGVTSFEGWLFPSTYEFEHGTLAVDILKEMIDETWAIIYKYNVTMDEVQDIITKASIIQKEVTSTADMAKVARVIDNRLEIGMPLAMDTIISYGVYKGTGKGVLELNQSDLDDASSPYNARLNTGLPPTPISNPGEEAIAAAVNPAVGDWLYFITVDPSTGETLFFDDEDDFQAARLDYKSWCANNSDVCYGQ
jgi:UPF0755 protein